MAADPSAPAPRHGSTADAVEELLRSARLWQSLGHPDEERGVLLKLLAVQPDEARALFLLGELELRGGHPDAARRALALLQAGAEGAPAAQRPAQARALRAGMLAELQRMETVYVHEQARLAELRLVMRGGNRRRALVLARELFPDGRPPGDLANEFAPVLASTAAGWRTSRAQLEQRIVANPGSMDRLSLYQLLAQHPETLAQAWDGFAGLAGARDIDPGLVADAWRESLRGLGDDEGAQAQRRRFLARFPHDPGIGRAAARAEAALARARAAQAEALAQAQEEQSPAAQARHAAERALDAGDLDAAEALLARSRELRALDPESDGLLGLLRFRQGRYEEATPLFERALAGDAERPALAARWRDLLPSSRYWGGLQAARRRRDAGDLDGAVALVRAARPLQPQQTEADLLLAELLAQQGRADESRAIVTALLAREPGNARAWRGWLSLELRAGRVDGALDRAQRLPAEAGVTVEAALDAGELRAAIERAGAAHPDAALRLLERSVALLPQEAWLRYDLARAYLGMGLAPLARQVMQEGQEQSPDGASMRYAAALIDAALDDEDAALARLAPIPPQEQTEGMRALAQRLRFERDLRLARLARDEDRPADDAQWRAQALAEAGGDAARRLRVARADLAADDVDGARALLDPLRDPQLALAEDDRRTLARLLVEAGAPDAALEQADMLAIAAATRAAAAGGTSPESGEAQVQSLLLRARVHRAQRDRAAERADWDALDDALARDEVPHRLETVELMDDDRLRARDWMAQMLGRHPQDPEVLLEAARQARRDGQNDAAAQWLQEAIAAPVPAAPPGAPAGPVPLLSGAAEGTQAILAAPAPTGAGPGPNRRAALELDELEAQRQPRVETAWLHIARNAQEGLSSLHGTEIPLVVSWPGGYDGHWFAQVDRVHLDAGVLAPPLADSGQFGKAQALPPTPGGLAAPIDEQAQGYSLAGGWRSDNRRFDLGIVGIGFKAPSLVGGWRENRTLDGTDVSVELTRRVVNSTLLSYAGAVDPSTGAIWGGVTQNALSARAGRDLGDRWSVSASLSAGVLAGRATAADVNEELRFALDRDWIRRRDLRLSAGPSLSLWHYAGNESFFTYGQDGTYSPQSYAAIGLPIEIEGRRGDWSYDARFVPSRSWTNEQPSPYYPTDAALQALAGQPQHGAGPGGGLSASVRADIEYRAAPHWTVGAWLDIDRSAYYQPTRFMLYLRYWVKPQEGLVPYPPHPVLPISQF
jgi:tetratricopeptide (TPR) repeat protein